MGEYDGLRSMAQRLIAKKGGLFLLTKVGRSAYNATTDAVTETTTTQSVKGVVLPPGTVSKYENGTKTLNKTEVVWIAAKGLTVIPGVGDTITVNAVVRQIDEVTPHNPDGATVIAYMLLLGAVP